MSPYMGKSTLQVSLKDLEMGKVGEYAGLFRKAQSNYETFKILPFLHLKFMYFIASMNIYLHTHIHI